MGAVDGIGTIHAHLCQETYKATGKGRARKYIQGLLPGIKKEYPWLTDAYYQCLQVVALNLSTADKNFFDKRAKIPRFKSKHGRQSISYPSVKFSEYYLSIGDQTHNRGYSIKSRKTHHRRLILCKTNRGHGSPFFVFHRYSIRQNIRNNPSVRQGQKCCFGLTLIIFPPKRTIRCISCIMRLNGTEIHIIPL